jgi:cysteinyl-tRNA synthetase
VHAGGTVTDVSVFTRLARYYETEFHQDMQLLNVRPADALTRVSEYVPEIVTFIQEIIAKGYAYKGTDGSVSPYT